VLPAAVAVTCLLCTPSLFIGLIADDVGHRAFVLEHLRSKDAKGPFWDMFDICGRSGPTDVPLRIFNGRLPWWSSPQLKIAFFRPLSVASHYLDYWLWPKAPWLMHLHNIAWCGLIVLLAGLLYRRLLGTGALSLLALALYTVDEAHANGTAWIAARNTLMTAAFALLCLLLFDRARRDGSHVPLWLSTLALLLALASSEGAVATWAYLLAYALCIDKARVHDRVLALLPLAAVNLGWSVLSHKLGYGVEHSGSYADPRAHPLFFLRTAAERLPEVLRAQLTLPMEVSDKLSSASRSAANAICLGLLALTALFAVPLARRRPTARFFLLGMLGSALPICVGGAAPRLLFLTGLGAHGLVAELANAVFGDTIAEPQPRRTLGRVVAGSLLLLNGPVALAVAPLTPRVWLDYDSQVRRAMDSFPPDRGLEPSAVMVLNTPDYLVTMFAAIYRMTQTPRGRTRFVYVLGASEKPVMVRRPDRNALVLEPEGGYLLETESQLTRRPDERFKSGTIIPLYGLWVVVERTTTDGRPARIRLQMVYAEDPRFLWVTWDHAHQRFQRARLPPIGESVLLPGVSAP
jgi:hypothetical protein